MHDLSRLYVQGFLFIDVLVTDENTDYFVLISALYIQIHTRNMPMKAQLIFPCKMKNYCSFYLFNYSQNKKLLTFHYK